MKVMPINKSTTNVAKTGKFSKFAKAAVLTAGLAVAGMFPSCKKEDELKININPKPTATTERTDLIDFAFRDLVGSHNLDTVGYTRILKQSYPLNDGSYYTVDTFQIPSGNDTMYSNGIYHYNTNINGQYDDMPYSAIWTKTTYNGEDAVKAEYTYPWETNTSWKLSMPQPEVVYYIPGASGDNSMKMNIEPGTGGRTFNVDVVEDSAFYRVEDINVKNPYWVEVKNYDKSAIK